MKLVLKIAVLIDMRLLVLGGSGMLGHKLVQLFNPRFETFATLRGPSGEYARFGIYDESRTLGGVVAEKFETVAGAIASVRPDVVINCIGVVKQDAAAKDPITSIMVNSLFPHRVAEVCHQSKTRFIHLSTDCVFSGRKGNYAESDETDAQDLYGRTKLLGEVAGEGSLTIRTSMIGRELHGAHGLLEWFLSQKGDQVRGFKRAVFSGLTTNSLAGVIANVVEQHPELRGIWHVAGQPINKFDLLSLVREGYGLDVEIELDETFVCDRSLDGSRFCDATGFKAPTWQQLIQEMRYDPTPYDKIRRVDASR